MGVQSKAARLTMSKYKNISAIEHSHTVCRVVVKKGVYLRVWPRALYTWWSGTNNLCLSCYLRGAAVCT
jgi:hypothetical protein